jgi:glycine oxidase
VQPDFIVIGAGAVGLTSAIALLQAGYKVTLVERGQVGREASWAGGGILSPLCSWDYQESVTRLAHRGMAMFADAAESLQQATGIDSEYQHSGMLVLPPFPEEQAKRWCEQHQFTVQSVNASDYLPLENQTGLLLPEVAQVRNPRLISALRKRVEMLGGTILEQHEVQSFSDEAGRITALHTTQGTLAAGAYIVTAGAWSRQLLGEYALQLDIRPIRGQILLFKFDAPPFQPIVIKKDLYVIPRRDGHVLVGSTLEDVGFDKSTTPEARESLLKRVREIFPDWKNIQPIKHWAGFRPGSADNIPTIGRHPTIDNLYVNSGHFRYGVTMSFASAEVLLNEITGKAQPFSVEEYRWR